MRVTKENALAASRTDTAPGRLRPRSYIVLQVGLLILALALGFAVHQQGWHRPLVSFTTSFVRHPAFTVAALFHRSDLPTLRVDMHFEDYQRLVDKRNQALRLGISVASDQDYVPANLSHATTTAAVQMRLLEGPAGAPSDEAWPFEVTVQDNGTLLDLRRFILVPADTTVLSSWGYLETLRRAALLSSRYQLVHLVLNGSPKGIYAMEEQPTAASLAEQGRSGSATAYFDQSAYWEAYAQLGDALPGSGFQYAQITADCLPSTGSGQAPSSVRQASEGSAAAPLAPETVCGDAGRTLQALQAGECAPSEAWDVDKVGTFLALTTLWRGTSELDWRSVRLTYDPLTARFEPIGTGAVLLPAAPLPDRFTDDPQVQTAYVQALAQFSSPDYLAQLQADLGDNLEALQRALGIEMGYQELPWTALEAHQTVMRHQIAPSRTLFAYIEPDEENDALVLRLSNVQPFPVEIVGLDMGENAFLPAMSAWVAESDRALLVDAADAVVLRAAVGSTSQSVHLRVPPEALPDDEARAWQAPGAIRVVTCLFGLTNQNILVTAGYDDPAPSPGSDGRSP